MMSNIQIQTINADRKYWFIRSQSGAYYDEFVQEDYVGIGWDAFNEIHLFDSLKKDEFIQKIKEKYTNVKRPGYIYEQIRRFFNEISIGDIVMVPSTDSKQIAFGEVVGDVYNGTILEDDKNKEKCPFVKRRKIKWLKKLSRKDLDSHLYSLVYTHGTVTNATRYAPYIDRTLHSYFIKGDKTHLVLRVRKSEKVYSNELIPLLNGTSQIIEGLEKKIVGYSNGIELRLDVQSPGPVEFVFHKAVSTPVFRVVNTIFGRLRQIDDNLTDDIIELEMKLEEESILNKKSIDEVTDSAKKLKVEFLENWI